MRFPALLSVTLAFAVLVLSSGCAQDDRHVVIVGNDSDSHGCIGSAGYSWCAELGKCIRPWETNCTAAVACPADAKLCPDGTSVGRHGPDCAFDPCPSTNQSSPSGPIVGNDSDAHGCKGSAGYMWCDAKSECIRPWETPCEGNMTLASVMDLAARGCGNNGTLASNAMYNNYSRTYWVDLTPFEPAKGCSPACVVFQDNGSTEINWRCTGALPG